MTDPLTRFPANRTAALERLQTFLPHAGRTYAARRNYDLGRDQHLHVSQLSPYIRCRLLTEEEVLKTVLARFSPTSAEKFIQEVFWRTYWKGWLEMRPGVWSDYQIGLSQALNDLQTQGGLRQRWQDACAGQTDIAAFDAWAQELVETGYMHNHARMWFASIWIFTLGLPWQLGADYFLRHLLDGDPASNTLGWRWVAGIQTRGKTYLARASNIEKYTEGRFASPRGLADIAPPLEAASPPDRQPIAAPDAPPQTGRIGLILHDDALSPAFALDQMPSVAGTFVLTTRDQLSPLSPAAHVTAFSQAAAQDCTARYADRLGTIARGQTVEEILDWAQGFDHIATPYAPTGPNADILARVAQDRSVTRLQRDYDAAAWPYANAGFFKFKAKIPTLIGQMQGLSAA